MTLTLGFYDTMKGHVVEVDGAGFNENLLRLTCYTCGNTCLRQPYMTAKQWQEKAGAFEAVHGQLRQDTYRKAQ
jgi:hypothetical protein